MKISKSKISIHSRKIANVTKKTPMNELLMRRPELAGILVQSGLGCCGCPMAEMETIEQGCKGHGFSDEEIDKLIKKLNGEKSEKKKAKKKIKKKVNKK
jgi:hybrid cluster-associated redox disulfide protein